jgi:hypothetical protein
MRPLAVPFVVAPPSGARVRTQLRLDAADERVLRAVGEHLGRLAAVERRLAEGRVSVCRGGRRLAKLRHSVNVGDSDHHGDGDDATLRLTEAAWRTRWQAERLFLAADGEADKRWGNETIRVHPDQGWLELRLPAPLAYLSNTPDRAPTYRLACPVLFHHRTQEWAAQAASGAVRYDLFLDPTRQRWYADASWRLPAKQVPSLAALRQDRALGVDLNATHLDCWVVAVDPGWTSRWGRQYWLEALNQQTNWPVIVSGHHAAAVVIGRRGLGHRARRREGCAWRRPADRHQKATNSAGGP